MWTLGLALWMFDRERAPIVDWLKAKFAKVPELAEANIAALNAGHASGETAELGGQRSEEHTSELQSLMRISYAVFCLKQTKNAGEFTFVFGKTDIDVVKLLADKDTGLSKP